MQQSGIRPMERADSTIKLGRSLMTSFCPELLCPIWYVHLPGCWLLDRKRHGFEPALRSGSLDSFDPVIQCLAVLG